jgi:nucleotide-binding universal stress UspA family protein
MFETLVVALDGSACADHALDLARQLARAGGSRLALCSVADPSPLYGSLQPSSLVERTLEEIQRQARRIVDDALARARAEGIAAEGAVLEGEPVYEIVSYAKRVGADAIVIGTHGRSGLPRLFMGSVAEGVLRSAAIPVLTVRAQARLAPLKVEAAS